MSWGSMDFGKLMCSQCGERSRRDTGKWFVSKNGLRRRYYCDKCASSRARKAAGDPVHTGNDQGGA